MLQNLIFYTAFSGLAKLMESGLGRRKSMKINQMFAAFLTHVPQNLSSPGFLVALKI